MIIYPGGKPWAACLAALQSAGIALSHTDNVPDFDVAAAQAVVDAWPLAAAIAERCAEVEAIACSHREAAVVGVSPAEMASWPIKRAEALAWQAAPGAAAMPMLTAEAVARQVNVEVIAGRVLANAAALADLEATIAGVSGRHRDALRAMTSFGEVAAYDIQIGWPE